MIHKITWKFAGIISTSLVLISPTLWADGIPVILVTGTMGNLAESAPTLSRVGAAVGPSAWTGPTLGEAIRTRFGRTAPVLNTLASIRTRIDAARSSYNTALDGNDTAAMNTALDQLEQLAAELEANPDILATFADAREQHSRALLFVANTTFAHTPQRADAAIRRMVTVDAQQVFSARAARAEVRAAFQQQVTEMATAGLVVQSVAPGCDVFRDGRSVGRAPAQLNNLTPGSHHRISLRCAGQQSLLHPVLVAQGATSTVTFDIQLDQALDSNDTPALRYANLDTASSRWVSDLQAIGTALGVVRVFGVIPSQDKVVAVDVVSGTVAGESPITDGALLRRLANGGTVTAGTNSQGNSTANTGSAQSHNSSNSSGTSGTNSNPNSTNTGNGSSTDPQSNTVRPPQVGVGGDSQTTRQSTVPQLYVTNVIITGYPVTAVTLMTLGAGGIAAGAAFTVLSGNALNRAEQTSTSQAALERQGLLNASALDRTISIVGYAAGGALFVSGVLVGLFARDRRTERVPVTPAAQAFVLPQRDGVVLGIGGAM